MCKIILVDNLDSNANRLFSGIPIDKFIKLLPIIFIQSIFKIPDLGQFVLRSAYLLHFTEHFNHFEVAAEVEIGFLD